MLIKFEIKNFLSFDDSVEFNMLPARITNLENHRITLNNEINVLKMAAIYGANASGKSNFIKAIESLIDSVKLGKIVNDISNNYFKLNKINKDLPIEFLIEFYTERQHFCYCLDIIENKVLNERLSTIKKGKESLLFMRKLIFSKTKSTGKYDIEIDTSTNMENQLIDLIKESILQEDDLLIYIFNKYSSGKFEVIVDAFNWFDKKCLQLNFDSKVRHLTTFIEKNSAFKKFLDEKICNYGTGIKAIEIEIVPLDEYFGKNETDLLERVKKDLERSQENIPIQNYKENVRESIVFTHEKWMYFAKTLLFKHFGVDDDHSFRFQDESDGTKRLMELLPIFYIIHSGLTIFIDEIERSLHPKLIKDLISMFSSNKSLKGQIIFTTHETHLLDQSIIRTDEIWLCEKNEKGATHMEPLSNFEVHRTKNIQNGYLQGRYGAIPFLTN